ncbi:MAG: hypothetical protein MUD03_11320 [Pirellula sp.]|nr:hypothetical protein [Pirellula sp.]
MSLDYESEPSDAPISLIAPTFEYLSVAWKGDIDGHLELLDQTQLPLTLEVKQYRSVDSLFEAIVSLRVRGAPAIGIAAAYGVVIAAQNVHDQPLEMATKAILEHCDYLATSRPTAVNLFWALDRMRRVIERNKGIAGTDELARALLREARLIHDEDRRMCHTIGAYGASLLRELQHRWASDIRVWDGAGSDFYRTGSRPCAPGLCGRDQAIAARSSIDCLGIAATRYSLHADLRLHGGASHARGTRTSSHCWR